MSNRFTIPYFLIFIITFSFNTSAKKQEIIHFELFKNEKNWHYRIPSIITTQKGKVIALCNRRIGTVGDDAKSVDLVYRVSNDNGVSWEPIQTLATKKGWAMSLGSSVVNTTNGEILIIFEKSPNSQKAKREQKLSNEFKGIMVARSMDNGKNWKIEELSISPNSFGETGNCHGSGTGITLRHSKYKGRLLIPSRFALTNEDGERVLNRDHFNCAIYSDDNGKTWITSEPLQAGTGEGCLTELLDGTIYYNSRSYHNDGKRRIGYSKNGGETFTNFSTSKSLKECNGGTNAALLSLYSLDNEYHFILFSNPPVHTWRKKIDWDRKKMTIHISYNEGKTWHFVKRIFKGPSGYSSMTKTVDNFILLLYEKGEKRYNDSGLSIVRLPINSLLKKRHSKLEFY